MPVATKVTSSDASPQGDDATNVSVASHRIPTWTGAIYGTVPEAEIIGAAAYLLHTPTSACTVHMVDASVIGAHLRRAQEALYRGIKGPTSHLVNQHALSWIVEGLRRLPRLVGGPHHWVVRQSLHLAAVPLEAPDSAAARAMDRLSISSCQRSTPSCGCRGIMESSSRVCHPCKPFSKSGRWSGVR